MIIYKATNKINGKQYIGMTSKKLNKRMSVHKSVANNPKCHFHYGLRKHGFDNFVWDIIDTADDYDELREKEISWISYYDSYNKGYNSTLGGEGAIGVIFSTERKYNLSKALKGRVKSKEHLENISKSLKGRKLSDKHKNNMSKSLIGNTNSGKISIEIANDIRRLYTNGGYSIRSIAEFYDIHNSTISLIVNNKIWSK